jgi:hypothetical protein
VKPLTDDDQPVLVADLVSTHGPGGSARLAEWRAD